MKKIPLLLPLLLTFCLSLATPTASAQHEPSLLRKADREKMNRWVDSVYNAMTDDERVGQLIMIIAEPKLDAANMRRLERYVSELKIGGVLFHTGDPGTQAEVTNRLQRAARLPLFIALDGEWGLSMRLRGTTRFPKNMMLGAVQDTRLIEDYGAEVARQCREMGIHINFAPSVDVNTNASNPIIGTRSFGDDPEAVARRGIAYARGLESRGIMAVAKHYPGHGNTSSDSHYTLPLVNRSERQMDSIDLLPFRRFIAAGFSGIMTGHLSVPSLDGGEQGRAASLSPTIVTEILRKKDGFRGLCFTDALNMRGARPGERENPALSGIKAGNDIALAPSSPDKAVAALRAALDSGVISRKDLESKCRRILAYKYVAGLNHYRPIETRGLSERLNTPHADWLVAKLNEAAITLLKNDANCLPIKQLDKKRIALVTIGSADGDAFFSMLRRYAPVDIFRIYATTRDADFRHILSRLQPYETVICAVYSSRGAERADFLQLLGQKQTIYTFFTTPYTLRNHRDAIRTADAVVLAYESTAPAQEYAAQLIFGGIPARGRLSVSLPGLFQAGTGLTTTKTRLGYHRPEEVGFDPARLAEIDAIANEGVTRGAYPGCRVLVAKDGMIVYNKSFGWYDSRKTRKVTDDAVYDLASVSKATGTLPAVMKAYDDGLIRLNSPISAYVPALRGSNKSDFTVEELLYHQSGITPYIAFYQNARSDHGYMCDDGTSQCADTSRNALPASSLRTSSIGPSWLSDSPKPGYTTEVARRMYVHDSFRDHIMQDIRNSRLGTRGKYTYSCINFILLKMAVENVYSQSMDRLLNTYFFSRLGASSTTYNPLRKMDTLRIVPTEDDRVMRHQLLRGYVHDEAAALQGGVSGNAGLFSSADDLAKLLQLYLNNGNYGGESYISALTCNMFTHSQSHASRRGLGFDRPEKTPGKASPCGRLAPASAYGHTGFTGTCFWVDPDNQMIYIFLSNRVNPSRDNNRLSTLGIRSRIQDAIYKALKK
jgi:beta-lactamase